ncbi:MAG: hypothetical protein NVV70_15200 [Cellulomonas sp.]|nr:hypothetical protein [Cellulomonas sp.]MCR6649411.1 hypothetical protein [Cellulomonas sp.]
MGVTSGFGKNEDLFSGIGSLNLLDLTVIVSEGRDMRKRAVIAGTSLLVAAGIGLLMWAVPESEAPNQLRADEADGVLFLRHQPQLGDAVEHAGTFLLGADSCLYVVVDDKEGSTFIAAVGPDAHVTSDHVTLGPGRAFAMGEPAVFGRENVDGVPPDEVLTRCTRTSSVYGVG